MNDERRYFQLSRLSQSQRACAEIYSPVDSEGRPVYSGKPLDCVGPVSAKLVFHELTLLHDLISVNELVVSQRAAAIIGKFRLQDGSQSIPCKVLTEEGQLLRECVCFHFPKFLHVLDEYKSEFTPMPHQCRGPVVHPVLKRSLMAPYDLCNTVYVHCVCSENLTNAIHAAGLEGFEFKELECVD
jgi:hypothetical protein